MGFGHQPRRFNEKNINIQYLLTNTDSIYVSKEKLCKKIESSNFTSWAMEMVFCYQKSFDLLREKNVLVIEEKHLKFEAEIQEFAIF